MVRNYWFHEKKTGFIFSLKVDWLQYENKEETFCFVLFTANEI